jgi:serine/threonine protein phosphatase PrpC
VNAGFELTMTGCTDTGRVREHNEDAIAWDAPAGLAILADGMGGHNAGDVASHMAVDGLMHLISGNCAANGTISDCIPVLREAVRQTNADILGHAHRDPRCAQMGTTVVLSLFRGTRMLTMHAGDSRAYRLRGTQFAALTQDHSLVRQLVEQGAMTEEDARNSPYTSVITRALGCHATVEPELQEFEVAPGDIYVLCSDGLYTVVREDDIRTILLEARGDWEVAARQLVQRANDGGGRDNISVIIVSVVDNS